MAYTIHNGKAVRLSKPTDRRLFVNEKLIKHWIEPDPAPNEVQEEWMRRVCAKAAAFPPEVEFNIIKFHLKVNPAMLRTRAAGQYAYRARNFLLRYSESSR